MSEMLSEEVIMDLSDHVIRKIESTITDALQLVPNDKQRMVIATHVAAFPFAMAARFMQAAMHKEHGTPPEWRDCVEAAVKFVAKLAIEIPPPPISSTHGETR